MNAKKAKALRKIARQLVKQEVVKEGWVANGYINHQKVVPTTEQDEAGDNITVFKNMTVQQAVVNPNCGKGVYKRMKNHGVEAVFAGKA